MAHQKFTTIIKALDKYTDWPKVARNLGLHRNTLRTYKNGDGKRKIIEASIATDVVNEFRKYADDVNQALENVERILCE